MDKTLESIFRSMESYYKLTNQERDEARLMYEDYQHWKASKDMGIPHE